MLHTAYGDVLQHLHLLFGERAGRRHNDGFARVNAQRVEILHGCHGEATVVLVADALELYLFPAFQRFLDQNLRGEGEGALGQLHEGFLVGADARAKTAQGVGRAYHDGEAYLTGSFQGVVHVLYGMADGNLQVHLGQLLDKQVAVFSVHDGLDTRAQHLDAVLLQHARLV